MPAYLRTADTDVRYGQLHLQGARGWWVGTDITSTYVGPCLNDALCQGMVCCAVFPQLRSALLNLSQSPVVFFFAELQGLGRLEEIILRYPQSPESQRRVGMPCYRKLCSKLTCNNLPLHV